jgi:5-methylcytosine-specific restriction endonuclease McrA
MRIEILLFIIASLIIANIYTDGKHLKTLMNYKKYYQMGGVAIGAFFLYWLIKKNPASTKELILSSNEYIKYLPVDKNVTSFIEPLIDFTAKQTMQDVYTTDNYPSNPPIISMGGGGGNKMGGGGGIKETNKFKRSVSESKKKYIASKQAWKCKECNTVLPATYEVDHIVRLQHGGSNEIDNLQALCPSCHRNKTMMETLSL